MRSARRLIVVLVCLAIGDQFVLGALRRAEEHRYEETPAFRFESSDLFGLGPLVAYLREHPRGDRPRAIFLGNSVMFGFELAPADTVPARFQARHPDTKVFNAAVNGFDLGGNYLVAKAVIDAVDRIYVMRGTPVVNPRLASLIPVDPDDVHAFHLEPADPIESRLQPIANGWKLYAASYRLQAAYFGTSTREYIHRGLRPPAGRAFSPVDGAQVRAVRWMAATPPDASRRADLRQRDELLWAFAELIERHGKRGIVLQFGAPTGSMGESELADFNAAFASSVQVVGLSVDPALTFDGRHLTPAGARLAAEQLP